MLPPNSVLSASPPPPGLIIVTDPNSGIMPLVTVLNISDAGVPPTGGMSVLSFGGHGVVQKKQCKQCSDKGKTRKPNVMTKVRATTTPVAAVSAVPTPVSVPVPIPVLAPTA